MEMAIQKQALAKTMASQPAKDNALHLNLEGRDPEDGAKDVAYVKGALFLKCLEETFGRSRFDPFLRSYFETFCISEHLFRRLCGISEIQSVEATSGVPLRFLVRKCFPLFMSGFMVPICLPMPRSWIPARWMRLNNRLIGG